MPYDMIQSSHMFIPATMLREVVDEIGISAIFNKGTIGLKVAVTVTFTLSPRASVMPLERRASQEVSIDPVPGPLSYAMVIASLAVRFTNAITFCARVRIPSQSL
jgi:hypothetical protein